MMKLSKYVSCIPVQNHTLVYNAFRDKYVVIKHHTLDRNSLKEFAEGKSHLYNDLCEAGVYIPKDTDEISLLRNRIIEADSKNDEFLLDINPTLDCNFNCWYCYEKHIKESMMSTDTVSQVKTVISEILSRVSIKSLCLGFFGGEPLIGFHQVVKPLIKHAELESQRFGKQLRLHFTTNAGLLDTEISEFLSKYECNLQITLDGGRLRHDQVRFFKGGKGSYDHIMKGVMGLLERKIHVMLRVNYDSKNIDTIDAMIDDLNEIPQDSRKYMVVDFQRVWQDRDERGDVTETKAMEIRCRCEELGFQVACNFLLKDVRQSCYADKVNHALINYDGNVFACTARDFKQDIAIGVLSQDGRIEYKPEVLALRRTAKLSKAICQECRIAPICGGGCSQKALEGLSHDRCNQGYSEEDMDNIILDIFQYSVMGEYPK